jgi:hypothetical protein
LNAWYFFKNRLDFIRFFYDASEKPFREIQRKIEASESPFDKPPYSEDPEPPFLDQWIEAETGIYVLGMSCVSLLSDALKLYFRALETRVIGFSLSDAGKAIAGKEGFVAAYKLALGQILETDWSDCAARFDIIEQVVLARNRGQHGNSLASFHETHDSRTLKKHRAPFFANDRERQAWIDADGDPNAMFLRPFLEISRDNLHQAIDEAANLGAYIDERLNRAWKMRERSSGVDAT